jgi:hypothetical protein
MKHPYAWEGRTIVGDPAQWRSYRAARARGYLPAWRRGMLASNDGILPPLPISFLLISLGFLSLTRRATPAISRTWSPNPLK